MSEENDKVDLKRSAPSDVTEPEVATEAQRVDAEEEGENDGWIGPLPSEQSAAVPAKKKKGT